MLARGSERVGVRRVLECDAFALVFSLSRCLPHSPRNARQQSGYPEKSTSSVAVSMVDDCEVGMGFFHWEVGVQ